MNKLLATIILIIILATELNAQVDSNWILSNYKSAAEKIFNHISQDSSSWERMAYLCDTFGHRLSGSQNLSQAINWIEQEMKLDGLANVRKEKIMVPKWIRGNEYCELISPRKDKIFLTGLGGSIGTPAEGITAEVLVVKDFDELKLRSSEAKGKIVIYNQEFKNYGQSVQYRFYGAIRAAQAGAVASLCRAVSPHSMRHGHTGMMAYNDTVPKIPHGSISAEDAMLLDRMQKRGHKPVIKLYMEAKFLPDDESFNLMGELEGRELKDEIIAIGGHIDSWDVGTGAQDDAGGCVATWEALKLLKNLGLTPRRTVRCVMWTNEENGVRGGRGYADAHKDEKHVLMFEFDSGTFPPSEMQYSGPDSLLEIVRHMKPLLQKFGKVEVTNHGGGVDIDPMVKLGVPAMSLNTDDKGEYFWYHHSDTDTPDKINPQDLNMCIGAIALAIYIYADLPIKLNSQLDSPTRLSK